MAGNKKLTEAARAKNDEFYTQFDDIQKELNHYYLYNKDFLRDKTVLLPCDDPEWSMFTEFFIQNFDTYGLKKLISTSYAVNSKKIKYPVQPTLWEAQSPHFDPQITDSRGKIFTLTREDFDDSAQYPKNLKWRYLEGDGDFRSAEVKKLRDEADVIITNPPFSLFREFLAWINPYKKQFLVIANKNCITYKEIFPLIKDNIIWAGCRPWAGGMWMVSINHEYVDKVIAGKNYKNVPAIWLTNLDHAKRHEPLRLMTMAENLRHNKKLIKAGGYRRYDNYDAIDVPFTDAIPSDYFGDMGVPITYLDKHNPDQFEIVKFRKGNDDRDLTYTVEDNTISSDAGCRMPDAGCRMPDAGCRMPDAGCRMPDAGELRHTSESSFGRKCSGVMGVPITFLDKYNPEQFELIGASESEGKGFSNGLWDSSSGIAQPVINGERQYKRLFIRWKVQRRHGGADNFSG